MIIDTLNNALIYEPLGPRFAKAFDYLRSGRPASDEPGTYKLDGDNVFAIVQTYNTKPHDLGRWEAHRKYADVQFVVSGREMIGYTPLKDLTEEQAYDAEADIAFYFGSGNKLAVPAGTFMVLFPHDAHMPCLTFAEKSEPVRKVVVKVRING